MVTVQTALSFALLVGTGFQMNDTGCGMRRQAKQMFLQHSIVQVQPISRI